MFFEVENVLQLHYNNYYVTFEKNGLAKIREPFKNFHFIYNIFIHLFIFHTLFFLICPEFESKGERFGDSRPFTLTPRYFSSIFKAAYKTFEKKNPPFFRPWTFLARKWSHFLHACKRAHNQSSDGEDLFFSAPPHLLSLSMMGSILWNIFNWKRSPTTIGSLVPKVRIKSKSCFP